MNKLSAVIMGMALLAILVFQQSEIELIHSDVREIQQFLIHTNERISYTHEDVDCLAKNIYHEAGVESMDGKYAVAQVTLNRLRLGHWGNTICGVVYSKAQFSWTLDKKLRREVPQGRAWRNSQDVAYEVLEQGARVPSLQSSTYYHADYIPQPTWARPMARLQQIGQHIFYSRS
jgi:hypothetical protein